MISTHSTSTSIARQLITKSAPNRIKIHQSLKKRSMLSRKDLYHKIFKLFKIVTLNIRKWRKSFLRKPISSKMQSLFISSSTGQNSTLRTLAVSRLDFRTHWPDLVLLKVEWHWVQSSLGSPRLPLLTTLWSLKGWQMSREKIFRNFQKIERCTSSWAERKSIIQQLT